MSLAGKKTGLKEDDKESNQEELKGLKSSIQEPEEELLAEQFYNTNSTDYEQLFNYEKNVTVSYHPEEEQYSSSTTVVQDTASEMMTTEEAEETMESVSLAQVLGTKHDVSYVTRKRLANWVSFNPVLMRLFEAQNLTRDVNYAEF